MTLTLPPNCKGPGRKGEGYIQCRHSEKDIRGKGCTMKDEKRVILTGTLLFALKFAKTASNGYYHFKNLKSGTYKVRIKLCNKSGGKTVGISGEDKKPKEKFQQELGV